MLMLVGEEFITEEVREQLIFCDKGSCDPVEKASVEQLRKLVELAEDWLVKLIKAGVQPEVRSAVKAGVGGTTAVLLSVRKIGVPVKSIPVDPINQQKFKIKLTSFLIARGYSFDDISMKIDGVFNEY